MKFFITIVLLVYKVKQYLNKCLDSILSQTYHNFELILVDDGSPDNCGIICDHYALNDNRIKVIHQKNQGLSAVRNSDINIAKGDYITFVDSDDYISKDYLWKLVNIAESYDCEVAAAAYKTVEENEKFCADDSSIVDIDVVSHREMLEEMFYVQKLDVSAWFKIYKTELFKDIRYTVGKNYEDLATTYKLIAKSNKTVFVYKILYYYLQRTGSIMGQKRFRNNMMEEVYYVMEIFEFIKERFPIAYDSSMWWQLLWMVHQKL